MVDDKNIGKIAVWRSQSGGFWKEKTGRIVGVCRPGKQPALYARQLFPDHKIMFDSILPVSRGKERYFVEVENGKGKPKLYYPQLTNLQVESGPN